MLPYCVEQKGLATIGYMHELGGRAWSISVAADLLHALGADVWHVTEDGLNLEATVEDAAACLASQGIPFMDRLRDPARAFEALLTETSNDGYDTFGALGVMMPRQSRIA